MAESGQAGAAASAAARGGPVEAAACGEATTTTARGERSVDATSEAATVKRPAKSARLAKSLVQTTSDKPPDFVVKLYTMFSELGPDLITWNDGKITIPGPSTKLAAVLPKYFRHGKFTSFQRQLNNFGFHKKISESSSKLRVYSREDMLGHPAEALLDLRRTPDKGCASWRRNDAKPETAKPTDAAPPKLTRVVSCASVSTLEAAAPPPAAPRPAETAPRQADAVSTVSDNDDDKAARRKSLEEKPPCDPAPKPEEEPLDDEDLGDIPDIDDDDCIDAFLDFLDKQVCGNVLSNDAVDLFKCPDLGLELTFPTDLSEAQSFSSLESVAAAP